MHAIPPEQLTELWHDLQKQTGGTLKTDAYSRTLYSTDASIYRIEPLGVFFPRHTDHIQAAVELAARHKVPVLMRGAGTGLAGQTVNRALVIDTSRHLSNVLEVNREERWARVQPGLVLDHLNAHLKPLGLQYGPDPATSNRATMGGIIGNNSTGSHSIMYGLAVDHIKAMSVVLSDGSTAEFGSVTGAQLDAYRSKPGLEGEIYRKLNDILGANRSVIQNGTPVHWRRCGGYNLDRLIAEPDTFNLASLVCGAEGTLAAISDLTVNLVDKPKFTGLGIIHFDDLRPSLEAVPSLLETGPAVIELLDNLGLTMCRQSPEYARQLTFVEGDPNCILIAEYTGDSPAEVSGKLDALQAHLKRHGIGTACVRAETAARQANVWAVRKAGLGLLMSVRGDFKPVPFIEDSAVPVEHLPEYISKLEDFCRNLDVKMIYYAHASAGCLHIRPIMNLKQADQIRKMEKISRAAMEMVAGYDGAWSSEHGDGRARSWLNERFFGPELYGLFRQVKSVFDPHNLMNPGIIVDSGPMTENLRFGADYQVIPLEEHLDFSDDMGFHRAVEMCNGAGVCRKESGTMCPSYMVTKDEEHSTRGRANLLRAALSGALPKSELTSHRMYEAMDLCVECKSCKAECPSSVDMTKLKTEFLAHYYRTHRVPLRSLIFGNFALVSRLASGPHAPLVNALMRNGLIRWGMDRFLGIDRRREFPAFVTQPFTAWMKKRKNSPSDDLSRKPVVLFHDPSNTYNHPEVAIAATEVLEAIGFRVISPGHCDCARPMISKGLVKQAKATATRTVAKLAPFANQDIPIVGLEPSSVSALNDDYLYMLPGNPDVRQVAKMATTFEEFIAGLIDDPDVELPSFAAPANIVLHGHCHQKALVGTSPAHKLLGLLGTDSRVTEIDSGCCGMAGSFGYESEHYDISMQMGERVLLPAIRAADAGSLIMAAGVSCRQQIEHGTGRTALHPAQVLRQSFDH